MPIAGLCQGAFALFTTYVPSLFPTLPRAFGSGLTYNLGRLCAAAGTFAFGVIVDYRNYRIAMLATGCMFALAAMASAFLPKDKSGQSDGTDD